MKTRTILVTGASRGIGRALSDRLANNGHVVVGVARGRDPTFPGELVPIDFGDDDAAADALQALTKRYSFDGVVNNVGMAKLHRLGEINLSDVEEMLRLNIHSAILTTQSVLPSFMESRWGRIVNVTSLVTIGTALRSGYAAAKAALNSLTRTWAMELAETGITVNAVAPGPTETEMFRRNTPAGSEAEARFLSTIPMRRLGKPEEIAAAIAFFLSEEASYITGQVLFADGGGSVGRTSV